MGWEDPPAALLDGGLPIAGMQMTTPPSFGIWAGKEKKERREEREEQGSRIWCFLFGSGGRQGTWRE